MADQERSITHDKDNSRFVISVDGKEAGFAAYVENDKVRSFNHTVVSPDFRGQGLSSPLIAAALDDSREGGYSIVPACSAVEHFVGKHEEYKDLVVD